MAWYDVFSWFYDLSLERLYRSYRDEAVAALNPAAGSTVIDLACGTGQNLPHLIAAMGDGGRVIGVDFSAGMLARAKKRVQKAQWQHVTLLERDARELTASDLEAACGGPVAVDGVLCALGLSVIPDWERVFEQTFALLRPGGRYVIFDVHAERWVPQTSIVQLMARADLKRKVWEPLEACSTDFELRWVTGSPHIHGGRTFIATGTRLG